MTPFIDKSIALIERPQTIIIGAPSDDTVTFDPYRQGIEVTNVKYFLQSNLPFISSKGLNKRSPNDVIDHELDSNNMGQGINLDGFKPFEDQYEIKNPIIILKENIVQSAEDPFYGKAAQDGEIDVFSDSGKRSLLPETKFTKSKGIRASVTTHGGAYYLKSNTKNYFIDAADSSLSIPAPGYAGNDVSSSLFTDNINISKLGTKLEYTYIGPEEKSPSTGHDYYGSPSGTDSIAYGGFLR